VDVNSNRFIFVSELNSVRDVFRDVDTTSINVDMYVDVDVDVDDDDDDDIFVYMLR